MPVAAKAPEDLVVVVRSRSVSSTRPHRYQRVGAMRGVEGSTATLSGVTPANVDFLARHYWIERIHLAGSP